MFVNREGVVSGSVNRAELAALHNAATDEEVKANLAATGAEHGMYVDRDGLLVDPSAPPVEEVEPEPKVESETVDGEPPRGGPGSGRDEWVAYAASLDIEVTDDMTRDDIIAAVDAEKE